MLLLGLGSLGGGLATARWLLAQGATLTITDTKTPEQLAPTLKELSSYPNITYALGGHNERDILAASIVVVNPAIPLTNPFLKIAVEQGIQIENELTLFSAYCAPQTVVAITGTRGKTTTTNWTGHFLRGMYPETYIGGNTPDSPLLSAQLGQDPTTPAVIEAPSFLLEHVAGSAFHPHVAIITNLYRDHLNRYRDMEHYADTKATVFVNQTENDFLILNADNDWTPYFIKKQKKSRTLFFSVTKPLPQKCDGICIENDSIVIIFDGKKEPVCAVHTVVDTWGPHNLENLLPALLTARLLGVSAVVLEKRLQSLQGIPFREELVYVNNGLSIYNDSTATSPEATVAALQRFRRKDEHVVLITGGTDAQLDFSAWVTQVTTLITKDRVVFLEGSATKKMLSALQWNDTVPYSTLKECFAEALRRATPPAVILFSPGAKSFEKFKNEFDRGAQFNALVTEYGAKHTSA